MKIEKSELALKLGKLKGITPDKQSNIVGGVLFQNNKLTAYNLMIGATASVDCDSDEAFVLPPKAIEMIESLPDGIVEITKGKNIISIKTGEIKNRFQTVPVEDFPQVDDIKNEIGNISISGEILQELIASVLYAVPVTSEKAIQTGVLLEATDGQLNAVGCDGYRMAWNAEPLDGNFDFVVPKAAIQKLLSMGLSGNINIAYDRRKIFFKSEDYTVFARLLEGSFIDYKQAWPKYKTGTSINRKALNDCLRRAMICIDDNAKVPVKLIFEDCSVKVELNSTILDYREQLTLDTPVPEPLVIGFNARYLLDAIKSFSGDTVQLMMSGELNPMIVTDKGLSALVLPVRLK